MIAELNQYNNGVDRSAYITTHRYEQTRKMIYDSGEFILFVLRDIFTMRNLIFAGLLTFCAELIFIFAMLVLIAF